MFPKYTLGWAHSYLLCHSRLMVSSFPGSLFSYTITFGITGEKSVSFFKPCLNALYSSGNLCAFHYVKTVYVALDLGDTGLSGRELALHKACVGGWMDG